MLHKKKSDYLCVLHFPRISAWITPTYYPVKKYVVVYNGKYKGKSCKCNDGENQIVIKVDNDALTLEFNSPRGTYTQKMPYAMNEICEYHCPVCDAWESWAIIVSDEPIQQERFMPGYQATKDGVYYNIEDMQEDERRFREMFF